jgi:uncharacterized membrane protein
MSMSDILIVFLIGAVLLLGPLVAFILSIIAFRRSARIHELARRVSLLEARLREQPDQAAVPVLAATPAKIVPPPERAPAQAEAAELLVDFEPSTEDSDLPVSSRDKTSREPFGWETLIGQKAFGWLAVLLFVFSAAFFLRYAYQNHWIGPVGRVAIGEIVGAGLLGLGWNYFRKNWLRFSSMLTATGIVVLYLATYSAFGFYRLLPQQHAGVFLAVLVIESMVLAVAYRSSVVALVAVIGGLLTPVLLQTDHDAYQSFFTYLAVLNAGVVVALLLRSWSVVGSVAYLGTQWLFWLWYAGNYHPEKFAWTLGFQAVLCGLYLVHTVIGSLLHSRQADWEELARFVVNAIMSFVAFRVLTRDDYGVWQGSAAIVLATLYAGVARATLAWRPKDNRLLLTSLAVAIGFLAWAFPIQADARWVALGWGAMGAAWWWFGLRVSAPPLRIMAGVLGASAVVRWLIFDMPTYTRDPFVPLFNLVALPSLGLAACILASVVLADRFLPRLRSVERWLIGAAGVTGVLLLWLILSFECYGYFVSHAIGSADFAVWNWRGQLALTVLWTVYATALLVLGFRLGRARLRWLAMGLFGVSVVKLFVVDMANVQQLYRILAFFVLAVVLGLVARAYQRFK